MPRHQLPNRLPRKRRGARKAGGRAGRRVPRSIAGTNDGGQMARIKETVEFVDLDPGLGYNFNFNLSQFRRASTLAPNFKFYKASLVEWTIEPLYNTFQDGTTGTEVTLPYMYLTMNRTQDSTGINLQDIQAMGAKPKKLVAKQTIKYRPNWCSPGLIAANIGQGQLANVGLQAQYSFLACPDTNVGLNLTQGFAPATAPGQFPTNSVVFANSVVYNGHTVYIDQAVPSGVLQPVAKVVCTVHWVFKDPHYTAAPETYVTVTPAKQSSESPAGKLLETDAGVADLSTLTSPPGTAPAVA